MSGAVADGSEGPPLLIIGAGVQCAVGLRLPDAAASVSGAIAGFRTEPRIRSARTGAQITAAWLETLPAATSAFERMQTMAVAAATEALAGVPNAEALTVPVLLALPAVRPGFDASAGRSLARDVMTMLPVTAERTRSGVLRGGHGAGVQLIGAARALLADGASAVLIGGAESYRDTETLASIERAGRLRTADDTLGWIPGEGAGFVLLATPDGAARLQTAAIAAIEADATAVEPRPWYGSQATLGEGLTTALQSVFARPGARAEAYCDLNGDLWRADEWGYANLRTASHWVAPLVVHHPADCWGDVGAATGPMLVALAAQRIAARRAAGDLGAPRAAVWTASDATPLRAACVVSYPPPTGALGAR